MRVKLTIILFAILFSAVSFGQGFDKQYEIFQGDFDNDGDIDIYVREQYEIILLHGDIVTPIVLPPEVDEFVLLQGANASLSLETDLKNLTLSNKQASNIKLTAIDINLDGFMDAVLTGVDTAVGGALDQVVFSNNLPGTPPFYLQSVSDTFKSFFGEVHGWFLDEFYFERVALENGWYEIHRGEERTGYWHIEYINIWYTFDNNQRFLDENDDATDPQNVPYFCTFYPSECVFSVANGAWLVYATATENNRIVYDYSNFNQNARSFTNAISPAVDADSLESGTTLAQTVANILKDVLGVDVFAGVLDGSNDRLEHEEGFPEEWLDDYRLAAIELMIAAVNKQVNEPSSEVSEDVDPLDSLSIIVQRIPGLERGDFAKVNAIVLHRTAGSTLEGALRSAKSSRIGTHFYIDKDGKIYRTASLGKYTYHVGRNIKSKCIQDPTTCTPQELTDAQKVQGIKELNKFERKKSYPDRYPTSLDSIGIEVVAEWDAGTSTFAAPTPAQLQSVENLVEALKTEYVLTNADVYHHDVVSYKQAGEGAGLGYD